ncbi:MAG: HNH endonuclease [Sphingopyxis sp.]
MSEDFVDGGLSKPDWIKDPETGELLPVEKNMEYHNLMSAFYGRECKHPELEPMKVMIADGRIQIMKACVNCGERVGTAMSQKDRAWVDSLMSLPEELVEGYRSRRARERHDILLSLARKQFAARGRFTKAYRDYLGSAEWQDRRNKVLRRCNGICEGCGEQRATEVHHLSYRHFMEEFLFELVGLCHDCHERWHGEAQEEDEENLEEDVQW